MSKGILLKAFTEYKQTNVEQMKYIHYENNISIVDLWTFVGIDLSIAKCILN